MNSRYRHVLLVTLLLPAAILTGCATGNVLTVQGDLSRPATPAPAGGSLARAVAVSDFVYAGPAGGEVGRDYDGVRPIVWKAAPGRQLPDLIARVLFERGIPVVRVRGEEAPPEAAARIWGRVDEVRLTVKRAGTLRIEENARVSLTVYGTGAGASSPYTTTVSSEYSATDPLVVTSERVLDALNGAANGAAEEAVRRLIAAGVIPAPYQEAPGAGASPAR